MSTTKININGIDKAEILKALYDNSKPLGMGLFHFDPTPMPLEDAKELISNHQYFDYLKGRVMKVNLSSDELDTWLYDRDNGVGAALRAIQHLL